jgi:type II secretory pathway pseudopilin PulG
VTWTRTDLLVVLAALSLLTTAIVVPVVNAGRQVRIVRCQANLQQISQALLGFSADHDNRLPDADPAFPGDLWWWYKERVKPYVVSTGNVAAAVNAVFACPDDRGYTDAKPFCRTARFASNSYVFNGVILPGIPNIAGRAVSAVRQPRLTLLTMEWTAHAPLSWHKSRTGRRNLPFYRDAESMVGYVDGHVSLTKFYYDGYNAAYTQDPVAGYAYKYSGD